MALPSRAPFNPTASSSLPAGAPGGFLKIDPAFGWPFGCSRSRRAFASRMLAASAAGSPRSSRSWTAVTIAPHRQLEPTVGEAEPLARQHDVLAALGHGFDGVDRASDLAAEGAGVHQEPAADRPRDALAELESRETLRDGLHDETLERHRRSDAQARHRAGELPFDEVERATELHDHSPRAAVADEQVRAATEEEDRHRVRGRSAEHTDELGNARDLDEHVRRSADAKAGVASERLAEPRRCPRRGERRQELGRGRDRRRRGRAPRRRRHRYGHEPPRGSASSSSFPTAFRVPHGPSPTAARPVDAA